MTFTPASAHLPVLRTHRWSPRACYAAAVLSPVVGALAVWTFGRVVGQVHLVVGSGADAHTVGPGSVVVVSLLVALAALGLAAVLSRTVGRPRRTWQVVAGAVLAVSLLGPLGGATTTAVLQLLSLHAVVALALFTTVPRMLPARRAARDRG